MLGICGYDPRPFAFTEERILPHEAEDLLVIDEKALPPELAGDAPVAIARKFAGDFLDPAPEISFLLLPFKGGCLGLVIKARGGKGQHFTPPSDVPKEGEVLADEFPFSS
jgi:hypothetical protein